MRAIFFVASILAYYSRGDQHGNKHGNHLRGCLALVQNSNNRSCRNKDKVSAITSHLSTNFSEYSKCPAELAAPASVTSFRQVIPYIDSAACCTAHSTLGLGRLLLLDAHERPCYPTLQPQVGGVVWPHQPVGMHACRMDGHDDMEQTLPISSTQQLVG